MGIKAWVGLKTKMNMGGVQTAHIMPKLEAVVDLRIGPGSSKKYEIVLFGDGSLGCPAGPATDGTRIFLPRTENNFKSKRDNEIAMADFTAHEADHIREGNEYFGDEAEKLRESGKSSVQAFLEKNYSELIENPALAWEIDNIVKDRRINAQRREKFPGVDRHYKECLIPMMEYFRPSTHGMNDLNAFRERYLQKAILGKNFEPVPENQQKLLEEVIAITESATSIYQDPEKVKQIYEIFKKNFDITQPLPNLPPIFGSGDSSQSANPPSSSQQGYGKKIKPRENRDPEEEKPKKMNPKYGKSKGEEQKSKEDKQDKENRQKKSKEEEKEKYQPPEKSEGEKLDERDSNECEIPIDHCKSERKFPKTDAESYFERYAAEVSSMKRIFRQLKARNYGDKKYFEGQELDFEEHLQEDLEAKATGIRVSRKSFIERAPNKVKPVFAIHGDVSGSTDGEILEAIKASFYIMGSALSVSEFNYSLYASDSSLYVLKSPTEKWTTDVTSKIASLDSWGSGIYFRKTSEVIARHLQRTEGNPKCMIVISDFESCDRAEVETGMIKELYDQKIYPLLIVIGEENEENAEFLQDIKREHYSVIPTDKLNELPGEIFRLFKTFGIAR